jgi:dUTP pyrophosphatase
MVKSKSGLNIRACINVEGVIDEGYTGSIKLRVYNHGDFDYSFSAGDKVTQLVVMPVIYPTYHAVATINGGERGDNGFGSTGA